MIMVKSDLEVVENEVIKVLIKKNKEGKLRDTV